MLIDFQVTVENVGDAFGGGHSVYSSGAYRVLRM